MKHSLQQIQKKIRRKEEAEFVRAQSELEQAPSAYRMSNQDQEKRMYKAALHSYHERATGSSKYNQDSVFDHHMKNIWSNPHDTFFAPVIRPVTECLWKKYSFQLDKCQRIRSISLFSSPITGVVSWDIKQVQLDFPFVLTCKTNISFLDQLRRHNPALMNRSILLH